MLIWWKRRVLHLLSKGFRARHVAARVSNISSSGCSVRKPVSDYLVDMWVSQTSARYVIPFPCAHPDRCISFLDAVIDLSCLVTAYDSWQYWPAMADSFRQELVDYHPHWTASETFINCYLVAIRPVTSGPVFGAWGFWRSYTWIGFIISQYCKSNKCTKVLPCRHFRHALLLFIPFNKHQSPSRLV